MTINDANSRRGRHNSLDLIEMPLDEIDSHYKDDECTSFDIKLDHPIDFNPSSDDHIDQENFEFAAFGFYSPTNTSGSRNRTTSTDSLRSALQSRFGGRERGLSYDFNLLPTSLRDIDIDYANEDISPLPVSAAEIEGISSHTAKVEARRRHLKTLPRHGKSPRNHAQSTRWQTRPAKAAVPGGDKLKVHFKFIGNNKLLAKQQSRLSNAKKKMNLSSKQGGMKLKKIPSGRAKVGKGKSTIHSSEHGNISSRPILASSCVVVTSEMPPGKDKTTGTLKLSTSPIRGQEMSKVIAKSSIASSSSRGVKVHNGVNGFDGARFAHTRVKIEGGARKVQPVSSTTMSGTQKSTKSDLSQFFQRSTPAKLPAKLPPRICFGNPLDPNAKLVGRYTVEQRRERVQRFLEKRKLRVWKKKVKYGCRKKLADSRPRVKGRFVPRHIQNEVLEQQRLAKLAEQSGSTTPTTSPARTRLETPKPRSSKAKSKSVDSLSPSGMKTHSKRRDGRVDRELQYADNFATTQENSGKKYISLDSDDLDSPGLNKQSVRVHAETKL